MLAQIYHLSKTYVQYRSAPFQKSPVHARHSCSYRCGQLSQQRVLIQQTILSKQKSSTSIKICKVIYKTKRCLLFPNSAELSIDTVSQLPYKESAQLKVLSSCSHVTSVLNAICLSLQFPCQQPINFQKKKKKSIRSAFSKTLNQKPQSCNLLFHISYFLA